MLHLNILQPFSAFFLLFFCCCCFCVLSHIWLDLQFRQPFFFFCFLCCSFQISFVDGCACLCVCVQSPLLLGYTSFHFFVAVLIIIITTAIHPFLGQFHDIASIIDFCLMRCLPFCVYPLTTHIFCCCFYIRLQFTNAQPLFFCCCSICFSVHRFSRA